MSGFMTFERFVQTTVDVYFGPGINDAQYLIVTIGLYWLIMSMRALSHDEPWPGIDEDELAEACEVCRSNAESCLADLPYHLPNTLDYVIALSFAVGDACREVPIIPSGRIFQPVSCSYPGLRPILSRAD